jgi:hypothetical protein
MVKARLVECKIHELEGNREATETVYGNSPLLRHFEAKAAALSQETFQLRDACRHHSSLQIMVDSPLKKWRGRPCDGSACGARP